MSMNFVLEATTLFAGCLALTSAQTPTPETIQRRGWFYFGVNSNYHAWRHGFPAGTTLVMLVTGNRDVDGFFHAQLYDEARGNINDFWTHLSYAHAECELNDEEEEISLAYMYYVCCEMNGSLIFCPKPCEADPCPVNSDCSTTHYGLFSDNYQCNCHPGYTWDSFQRDCVGPGGVVPSGGNTTTTSPPAANATTGSPGITTGRGTVSGVQPFSYQSSSSSLTTTTSPKPLQTTIPPPLTWDNFTRLYTDWRHGFPPGTTLSSVLPGIVDPDDVLDNLYHRLAKGNPGEFWKHMLAASTVGDLTSDHQLLSLAYIYYLCRETLSQNSECPDPCGGSPCAAVTCTVTGAGLFSNDYQCNCAEHHHWDPQLARCVFCAPGTTWSEVHQQCVHSAAASVAPTTGNVPGSPSGPWSAWSTWSACSSDCGVGTRSRSRSCRHGPCRGNPREQEKCQGNGFWQCYGMLVYGGAIAVALLALLAGVLLFMSTKRSEEREDGYKKLARGQEERTRQRKPASRRRATVKPSARRPTRQDKPRLDRPDQRRKPSPRRPLETREADQRWDPRVYPTDADRQREPRDYPSDTDHQWEPRDYYSDTDRQWEPRDYPPNNDRQWGQLDYPDQTDRYYNEYHQSAQPASYDPYRRQTNYYYNF